MSISPVAGDEYYADSDGLRNFIGIVNETRSTVAEPQALLELLEPAFGQLLADDDWLPAEFAEPYLASGMGGGIGQYLLYRSADRSLTLFSLVVPAGSSTPVHDHLAWGLVGLYRGEQHEEVYALNHGDPDQGDANLRLTEERDLHVGEFYPLLPPDGDIHRVTTISPEASISIHLLGNDAGCVVRHRYEPELSRSASFRSGYSNVDCVDEEMD
ncbi:MAG TPA: hypothetical protein VHV31_06930 [Nitrolancea sp.]|jgi:predicted metal-dependent enzyme (double-stranded beta helix superfamily)|nr:hypothetical protein [Nitrolancea sp.]